MPVRSLVFRAAVAVLPTLLALASAASGVVPVSFAPAVAYPTGTNTAPAAVAVADFNKDGVLDVAVANSTAGTVHIFPGIGGAALGAVAATLTTGSGPNAIVAGDLNNDGHADLVVANMTAGTLSVFVSTGIGFGFMPAITVTLSGAAPAPSALVLGFFDADNVLDLAVANAGANRADVLVGNGDGTFTAGAPLIFQPRPSAIATADLDNDGHPDLVLARREITGAGTAAIFLGGADGGLFRGFGAIGTISQPTGIAAADINDDGAPDLVVSGGDADRIVLLSGNGDGTFNPPVRFSVGGAPQAVAVGDLNHDGMPDVVTANQDDDSVTVLPGTGIGGFGPAQPFTVAHQPQAVAVVDLDGDNFPEIITANHGGNSVSVLLNLTGAVTPGPTPTIIPGPAIAIGTVMANAGQSAAVTVSLHPNGAMVAGVQNDIAFDPSRVGLDPNHCKINPALSKILSKSLMVKDATHAVVRAIVLSLDDVAAIPEGGLYTCTFDVLAATPPGSYALIARSAVASDAAGDAIAGVQASDGAIVVAGATVTSTATPSPTRSGTRSPSPSATPTGSQTTTATQTSTPTQTPPATASPTGSPLQSATETVTTSPPPSATTSPTLSLSPSLTPSSPPTVTPSPTSSATATVVDSATPTGTVTSPNCVGDCDRGGTVSVDELVLGVNISLGNAELLQCRAADGDGDGHVAVNELVMAVNNSLNGCPL